MAAPLPPSSPDALSTVLANVELTARMFVAGEFCGSWAVDTGGSRQIPFHVLGSGEAWLHVDRQPPQRLLAGDLIVLTRDQHHVISDSRERPPAAAINRGMSGGDKVTTMLCGYFGFGDQRLLIPLLESLPAVIVLSGSDLPGGLQVRGLVNLILDELAQQRPGFYAFINQLGLLLFIETVRKLMDHKRLGTGLLAALFDRRLGPVLSAIHARPAEDWTLETLAGLAAMSRSSFAERFRSRMGVSPMKYLSLWRMSEARRLLRTTDQAMAQIADAAGYQSEPAFRKAFRTVVGVPPGHYRAQHRSTAPGDWMIGP